VHSPVRYWGMGTQEQGIRGAQPRTDRGIRGAQPR